MATVLDPASFDHVFQGRDDDKIIARPGEPIVNIDAKAARRKVNGYVAGEISMMMGGVDPALIYSEGRLVWRVPIIFTTPFDGQLGVVGTIDVDAKTSDLLIPPNLEATLHAKANALLKRAAHSPESAR